ncbi:MAG: ABC transporter permease [Acidobacteria bacterium]|nr:ABC transporter permease [Acidobacteriota bacterium]
MRRIIAQARKELTQVLRDRLTLVLALLLPLALLALMGTAISLSVTDLPVVVQDLDNSPESRRLIEAFRASLTFRVVEMPVDEQPEQSLIDNNARGAIVIPENFGRDLVRGQNTEVQFLVDASDANTANIMRGAANAVTQNFVKSLRAKTALPIKADVRLWFNPGRESSKYIAPSMLAVGLSLFPPLLAALALSREGEQKTILQVYVSSISAHEYLLGKIAAYFTIALAEWFLSLLLTFFLFGLRLRGDPTPFLVCTVIYLFCTVSFGTMVGAAIPNQAAAIQAVQLAGFLLSYLLSGAIFPVANIPVPLNFISYVIPARYYIVVVRDALVRGGGWAGVWHAPFVLAAIGGFFFLIAWKNMRKMQVEA